MVLPDARSQLHLTQPSSSYIGHMSHRLHVSLIPSGQASAYIYLILDKQAGSKASFLLSVFLSVSLSKDWQENFLRQLQKQFSWTWAAHYQWSSTPPPPSLGLWQSPSVFIYPLSMSLHHPAHASATHPHQPTPVTFCSALLQQDLFSSLSCQEMAEAHLIEPPRGRVVI